jgi:peroxiredoxin
MRQFVKLSDIQDKFQAIGVNVGGMTYDEADVIQQFHAEWGLAYPLLRDVDGQHVDAWGIRNEEYGPGTFAYGIPHPGVVLLSPDGEILAKWAEAGYRSRADWKAVFSDVRTILGGG